MLTRFSQQDIVVSTDSLVTSTWSNNTNNLQTGYTASNNHFNSPTSSGWFHLDVYNIDPASSAAEIQYSCGYGNRLGSGSPDFTADSGSHGMNASRATYGAYRNLVFGDEAQNFTFDTHVPEDIWVINVNRARYKQSLKPGSLNIKISGSQIVDGINPSKGFMFELTDDSVTSNGSAKLTNLGRQFNIVSGTSGVRSGSFLGQIAGSSSFGLFYPDAGIIILNPDNFGTGSLKPFRNDGTSNTDRNPEKLYHAISSAGHFIIDSEEKVTSQYYFTRVKNSEHNYTTNPSFIDEQGNLRFQSMADQPTVYITTVGLYNDNGDLLAVAKLSKPLAKDFTKESLIKVKIDY